MQIYEALASDELSDHMRQEYIKYLIDFYISKTHTRLAPVGFIQGLVNTETYGITNLDWNDGYKFKDALRDMRVEAKFQRSEQDSNQMELLFDASEEQMEDIQHRLSRFLKNANVEKIDVLPQWVKSFLLRTS